MARCWCGVLFLVRERRVVRLNFGIGAGGRPVARRVERPVSGALLSYGYEKVQSRFACHFREARMLGWFRTCAGVCLVLTSQAFAKDNETTQRGRVIPLPPIQFSEAADQAPAGTRSVSVPGVRRSRPRGPAGRASGFAGAGPGAGTAFGEGGRRAEADGARGSSGDGTRGRRGGGRHRRSAPAIDVAATLGEFCGAGRRRGTVQSGHGGCGGAESPDGHACEPGSDSDAGRRGDQHDTFE